MFYTPANVDNITHTLIGAAVGQWAAQADLEATPEVSLGRHTARRRLFIWTSVFANNLPDVDVFYTSITPGPLGSLLHHRGHTHTLLGLIPLWLLILLVFWMLRGRFRLIEISPGEWLKAMSLGALGLLLHLVADSMNSYGVHPFYPLWNGWLYGDAVFILEPLIWAVLGAAVFQAGRSWIRYLPPLLLVLLVGYAVKDSLIQPFHGTFVLTFFAFCFFVFRLWRHKAPALALFLVGVFAAGNLGMAGLLSSQMKSKWSQPENTLLDVILSPMPAHPLCWSTITVSVSSDKYKVARGMTSIFPWLISPEDCPRLGWRTGETSSKSPLGWAETAWIEESLHEVSKFEALEQDCELRSWMRFARAPFLYQDEAVDMRFSRRGMRNFTAMPYRGTSVCPPRIPPWSPPRLDLIRKLGGESWFLEKEEL